MSRIIRSANAHPAEDKQIEIKIRNMFESDFDSEESEREEEAIPQLTVEDILAERDSILQAAKQDIEAERQQFEQFSNEQLQAIEELKQLWDEEKLQLQQQAYDEGFGQGYEEGMQKATADMTESLAVANQTMARVMRQK